MQKKAQKTKPFPSTFKIRADISLKKRFLLAIQDIIQGITYLRLIWMLGWLDIKLRYRGSILGPLWLTVSMGITAAVMGILYPVLFHISLHVYVPFITVSLILWGFLAGIITDATGSFIAGEALIKSVRLPYSVYVGRVLVRNFLILAHNIVIIIPVFLLLRINPGWVVFEVLPGIVLWVFTAIFVCYFLGTVSARFRDIPPIVASILLLASYVTPIFWMPSQIEGHKTMVKLFLLPNPFYTFLEVVRGPLLGQSPAPAVWFSACLWTLFFAMIGYIAFVRSRARLPFWV